MLLNSFCYQNMQYQTDAMTQIEEKWLKSPKVLILDIFWRLIMLIMLIMRERDFSRACGFLQMLINTLYLLNMRYGTDPMTQFWAKCEKPRFWANFDIIMLIMRKQDFFFKNRASSLFSTYLRATSCQKSKSKVGTEWAFCRKYFEYNFLWWRDIL